ncbi:MAG: hypothetical protein H6717_25740 [Polyangiaceae bacterium]|nr:hypothetical protein [Polyangiaceae bacterium]
MIVFVRGVDEEAVMKQWMSVWLVALGASAMVWISGCGDSGSDGGGGSSGSGASAGTGGGSGGSGGATGTEQCANKKDDDGDGFYDCDDTDCFDDAGCLADDLAIEKMTGFVPCGKPVSFTVSDSDMACEAYATSLFPSFGSKCQFASYSGTVTFLCPPAPKSDAVGLRWVVHGEVPMETVPGQPPIYWETLGGEFQFESGGGSAQNPLHKAFELAGSSTTEDFVGYDMVGVTPTTKSMFTEWFALWNVGGSAQPQVSGGFSVEVDAATLFGSN